MIGDFGLKVVAHHTKPAPVVDVSSVMGYSDTEYSTFKIAGVLDLPVSYPAVLPKERDQARKCFYARLSGTRVVLSYVVLFILCYLVES